MTYVVEGRTGPWELVIGLEVHAQVVSKSKLFSGASAEYGAAPNSQVSLVDAAFPGMLPVINQECVAQAVRTGLGLGAQINLWTEHMRTPQRVQHGSVRNAVRVKHITQNCPAAATGVVQVTHCAGSNTSSTAPKSTRQLMMQTLAARATARK